MNRKDFLVLYEEWLRNVNQDALWFEHRLDDVIGGNEPEIQDKGIYRHLSLIQKKVSNARPSAEYMLAQYLGGINIGESIELCND